MTMRAIIIVAAVLVQSTATLDAETLTCSTSSQGYRICQDQHGRHCIEWERDGVVIRDLTAHPPPGPDIIEECPMTPQRDHR
jgi:hypothetical protein